MEQNYVVVIKVHDSKGDSWANQVVAQYDNEWTAKAKYHSELARLIDALDYDFVLVMLIDTYGNKVSEFRDTRPTPEPPEPEQEG